MSSKEGHSLPKLTLRDFCFNKLNEDDQKLRKNPLSMPKLYTVAQSLQDAYVYRNLKPELGSLGEFLGGTLQLRHEKKKKNDRPEQTQQKRIRSQMLLHKRQPEDVLQAKDSSALERRVACRIILESIFVKEFGTDLEHFCSQPVKPYEWTQIPPKIQRFKEQFKSPPGLQVQLDQFLNFKQPEGVGEVSESENIQRSKVPSRQKHALEHRKIIIHSKQKIKNQFAKLKLKYKVLSKFNTDDRDGFQAEKSLKQKRKDLENLSAFQQEEQIKQKCRLMGSTEKEGNSSLFILTNKYFVLRKVSIQPDLFLYVITNSISFQTIRKVNLSDTNLNEQFACILIEMLGKFAFHLESLVLSHIQASPRLIQLISTVLSETQLKILSLTNCSIVTKLFCELCLGIGQSTTIEILVLSHNYIDTRALKSLNIIIRYIPQLKHIDLTHNKLNQLDDRTIKLIHQTKKCLLVGTTQQGDR